MGLWLEERHNWYLLEEKVSMSKTMAGELFGPFSVDETERRRLVRLCLHFTGNVDAAEDLAQETLIEAWRHVSNLRNPAAHRAWLSSIASNVCRRWVRQHARDSAHTMQVRLVDDADQVGLVEIVADDYDLEVELEQQELAELLDRALALLPPEMRHLLVAKYIMEQPLAEIARPLGLSEGAIAMRLQRGRLALKKVLTNELSQEASSFGLVDDAWTSWQQTRIWCPLCGRGYLRGFLEHDSGIFMMHCSVCSKAPDDHIWSSQMPELFQGIKGFKALISREFNWSHDYFRQALVNGTIACSCCGHETILNVGLPTDSWLKAHSRYGLHVRCSACGACVSASLTGYLRGLPEAQRFWRCYPRIHSIAPRQIEAGGRAALLTSFQNLSGNEHIDIVSDEETYTILGIYQ